MPPQSNEAVPEYVAPTKIQRVLCATYPVPSPSTNEYANWGGVVDDNDSELPFSDMKVKWYDSDEDSYSSMCLEDKNYTYKRPPTI